MKIFYTPTGEIYCIVTGDANVPGYPFMETAEKPSPAYEWVNPETKLLEHRPQFPITIDKQEILADGKDTAKLLEIPANTVCEYDNASHTITDGEIDFTCTTPGKYSLLFKLWPYVDRAILVTGKAVPSENTSS